MKKFVCWLIAAAFGCICLVVGPYIWHMAAFPAFSNSLAWAHFGSYIGGTLGALFALLNLAVALYIAKAVGDFRQQDLAAKRLSMDLFNEWHGTEMHQSRIAFSRIVEANLSVGNPMPTLSDLEKGMIDEERCRDAFRIYHFFEKWALLLKVGQADRDLLATFLGSYADWWHKVYFGPISESETDHYMKKALELIDAEVFSKAAQKLPTIAASKGNIQPHVSQTGP